MRTPPGINLRTLVLRQAGLLELCAQARNRTADALALIDGTVDTSHPALRDCQISRIGDSPSLPAGEHATFNASILVGDGADQESGRILAICSHCPLLNFAVVTDEMLAGRIPICDIASILTRAVDSAVEARCRTIVFGIEILEPESPAWIPLRASLLAATRGGSVVILPAGNRSGALAETSCNWPGALVTASRGWHGQLSRFSPLFGRAGNIISAPGEDIPGAGPGHGYVVHSGTSFAAAIAAGAFALARCLHPSRNLFDLAAELCPPPHRTLDGTALFAHQA